MLPEPWDDTVEAWTEGTPFAVRDRYHGLALTAFGVMSLWGERTGASLIVDPVEGELLSAGADASELSRGEVDFVVGGFYALRTPESCELPDAEGAGLFRRARERLDRWPAEQHLGLLAAGAGRSLVNLLA